MPSPSLPSEPLRIGLVGAYGHQTPRHYPGAEFAWSGDGYDQRALELAQASGVTRTFATMDEMLAEFDPHVVYIGTVYADNGRVAVSALEKGFDVVSEKPIAADDQTLVRLRELTAGGSRRIIAEFTMRWMGAFQKTRSLIAEGAIGETVHIQAQKTYRFGTRRPDFYKTREQFGGIIPWVASHAVDYAAWCTGLSYTSACARHGNRRFPDYPGMEDHAAMLFTMTGGVPCVISADFLRPSGAASHGDDRLRVTGTHGVIEVRGDFVTLASSSGEQQWTCETTEALHRQRAQDMVDAALGRPVSTISVADSLHITEACLAARTSADRNQAGIEHPPVAISSGRSL
ncbi:MAG TPA: Gfo/Idh/MocA family oxidoreductase [Terrimicrobiaceae bacterium]|nr:Gfo/Idh/MocA family oxidoreductase [Terrimicrobiaceae bacterium]